MKWPIFNEPLAAEIHNTPLSATFRSKILDVPYYIDLWCTDLGGLAGKSVLDFGCGAGMTTLGVALFHKPSVIIGIDINDNAKNLKYTLSAELIDLQWPENLSFETILPGDSLPKDKFDFVYSWSVIEHINLNLLNDTITGLYTTTRTDGYVLIQLSPLYLSPEGAHLNEYGLHNWEHLYMSEKQLFDIIWSTPNFSDQHRSATWGCFQTLNRITPDEIKAAFSRAGFQLVREYETFVDRQPPALLCETYPLDVLRRNQVVYLFKKVAKAEISDSLSRLGNIVNLFEDKVVKLNYGDEELAVFEGHFDPQDPGVTDQFLGQAETYDTRYFNPKTLPLKSTLQRVAPDLVPRRVLDVGSGSGNSVFALGRLYPEAEIVASDLSPAMLRILRRRALSEADLAARLYVVVANAAELRPKAGVFDLVIGSSMLHHLVEPFDTVKRLLHGVCSGGAAIFYEPFQAGYIVFRGCLDEIIRRAPVEGGVTERHLKFYRTLARGIDLFCKEDRSDPIYARLDDKWLFNRRHFEQTAEDCACLGLKIYSMNPPLHTFRDKLHTLHVRGLGEEIELAPWVIDILESCDESISPALRDELLMEGVIAFLK
jgi:ubiquinone/menaquinone biosynthesis C-methylase UbiE